MLALGGLLFLAVWCQANPYFDDIVSDLTRLEDRISSYPLEGTTCLTDCVNGRCLTSWNEYEICAPTAQYDQEQPSRITRALANRPKETVPQYIARIQRDPATKKQIVNDPKNPVKQYMYRDAGRVKLPLLVQAQILPRHIRPAGSRPGSNDISSAARTNCKNMGMNKGLPNKNNDQVGHFISWKNGGPPDWWNFAPQTQRINIGTTNEAATDVNAPSLWRRTEESITAWAQAGKRIDYTVVALYDPRLTRPIGFGTSETYYNLDGTVHHTIPSYWYSNDPYEDPDEWN